ncbi:MAG: ROK family protein [Oscillospiraceae bacterium]|jgi:N-acetylglucosamine repressor|nr:ROK family protein [Oscillospiraceae bacterium]
MKQDQATLRAYNKTSIMRILLTHESIYRAEISRMTGLSIPTVMKITDEFAQSGLIAEVGKGISSGGKPPRILQLIPNARFFIGVDARGPEYRCAIMNLRGELLTRHRIDASALQRSDPDSKGTMLRLLTDLIGQTIERSGVDRTRIVGVGIGVPYPINGKVGQIISLKDLDLVNFNIIEPIKAAFGLPVILENTAKTIALAEKWFGEAVNEENFSVISIGHGIGSAIFFCNEIYSGTNCMSGEIGHMSIDPNGSLCRCGNYGCLEAMASVTALHSYLQKRLKEGDKGALSRLAQPSTAEICTAAKAGDTLAVEALDRMTDYLSVGITNLVNLVDINLVLLTGGIIELYPELCAQISQKVNKKRGDYFGHHKISVKPLQIGPDAAIIGAATLLLKEVVDGGGVLT